jgi:hypothetical protein
MFTSLRDAITAEVQRARMHLVVDGMKIPWEEFYQNMYWGYDDVNGRR